MNSITKSITYRNDWITYQAGALDPALLYIGLLLPDNRKISAYLPVRYRSNIEERQMLRNVKSRISSQVQEEIE